MDLSEFWKMGIFNEYNIQFYRKENKILKPLKIDVKLFFVKKLLFWSEQILVLLVMETSFLLN